MVWSEGPKFNFVHWKKSRFSSLVILLSMNFSASISMELNLELQIMPFCLHRVVFSHRGKPVFFRLVADSLFKTALRVVRMNAFQPIFTLAPLFLTKVPSKPLFVCLLFLYFSKTPRHTVSDHSFPSFQSYFRSDLCEKSIAMWSRN